jgi:hypothetical protein
MPCYSTLFMSTIPENGINNHYLLKDIVLSTVHETHALVVRRSLAVGGRNVVALSLCTQY